MKKNDIRNIVNESKDLRAKHFLSLKEVVAQFLKYMLPEFYGNYSVEEIAKKFLSDPNKPNDPCVTLLNVEENEVGNLKQIKDLEFLAQLPKPIVVEDKTFETILVNIESQSYRPSNYSLPFRAIIYGCQSLISENRQLKLENADELYANAIPVFAFWIYFKPKGGKSYLRKYELKEVWNQPYGSERIKCSDDEGSLLNIYELGIGNDINIDEKNVYSYCKILLEDNNEDTVLKLFKAYGFYELGEDTMMLAGFERKAYNEGREEEREEILINIANNLIKQAEENTKSLTWEEALKEAKSLIKKPN